MKNDAVLPSIYLHIPFCAMKCPYCSFPVVVGQTHRTKEYLNALEREAAMHAATAVSTVYVGGGTPSVLSDEDIRHLAELIARHFIINHDERTFEMNPESVTASKAALLRSLGFTRASFGSQTFQPEYLRYLGRRHGAEQGFFAFKLLRDAGFDNINVDMMFGFPGQTMDELESDIDAVLSLGSEHVSLYALTIEPKSVFHVRGEKLLDDVQAAQYLRICARLNAAGIRQYEVSNFAKSGFESRHNLNYWQGGEYLGLGMGAHSHANGERRWNADTLPTYLQLISRGGSAVVGRERLAPEAKMVETFLVGLRMNAGVDMAALARRFESAWPQALRDELDVLIHEGFLVSREDRVCATDKGRLVLDEISGRLI